MRNLTALIWVELRKAVRSGMPLWTALATLFMPLGIAFLIFVARNAALSQKLGLVSAKADLVAYAAADWPAYLGLAGLMIAAGGLIFFVLVTSWVFGREFVDGTVKDLLAVPIARPTLLLAKFVVVGGWSGGLTGLMLAASLGLGAVIGLPGGSLPILLRHSQIVLITAALVICSLPPFAFLASLGRGYLLPLGVAILILMLANVAALTGWGEYFPWAVAGLFAQGEAALPPASYATVFITGLVGMGATALWWQYADQNR
jgi:ABC-2 type transport system permease protein